MMLETCSSCGAKTPPSLTGATHAYLDASPGCWARFSEVLAREYSDAQYFIVHPLTVDAYAAQHPGTERRQTVNSINLHLVSLYAYYHHQFELHQLSMLKKRLTDLNDQFRWLPVPDDFGEMTIHDIWVTETAQQHREAVMKWGEIVLDCWRDYYPYLGAIFSVATSQ